MAKWLGIIAIPFLFITLFFIYDFNMLHISSHAAKGYVLKPRESMFLDAVLMADSSMKGSIINNLSKDLPSTSAIQTEEAYNENQVAADQKYFNKTFLLTGIIKSINSGLGNEPYIIFRGMNYFASTQARFTKGSIEKIAALKNGQSLELVCDGAGSIVGTPMFNNCQFASEYAAKKLPEIKEEISNFLKGAKPSEEFLNHGYRRLIYFAIAEARSLPSVSACFPNESALLIDDIECEKELIAADKTMNIIERGTAVAEELRALGVQVPACLRQGGCSGQKSDDKSIMVSSKSAPENVPAVNLKGINKNAVIKEGKGRDVSPTCPTKHKQKQMVFDAVYLNGVYTEIPRGIRCDEVCDNPKIKSYVPCEKVGSFEKFASRRR